MGRDSFHRLRQTRAARIVGVYTATAWGVFEILDKTVRTFGWSEVIPRTSLILLIEPVLKSPPINQLLVTGGLLFFLQSLATLMFGISFVLVLVTARLVRRKDET